VQFKLLLKLTHYIGYKIMVWTAQFDRLRTESAWSYPGLLAVLTILHRSWVLMLNLRTAETHLVFLVCYLMVLSIAEVKYSQW